MVYKNGLPYFLSEAYHPDTGNNLTDFKNARKVQIEKIGEVKSKKIVTPATIDGIENELLKIVHLIACMDTGNAA